MKGSSTRTDIALLNQHAARLRKSLYRRPAGLLRYPYLMAGPVSFPYLVDWDAIWGGMAALLAPGPDGALSTVRFEVLRLGIQEAEARIFIEQALADDAARTKMGPELAKVCEDLLDERLHLFLKTQVKKPGPDADFFWFAERSGWQDRSERLFTTAGQVARATGRYRPGSEAP